MSGNDLSAGIVTSRVWDFGDGTTSTEKAPSHTYENAGSYTVSLEVTGPGGSDVKTRTGFIIAVSQYSYVQPEGNCNGQIPCYSSVQSAIDDGDTVAILKIAEGAYSEDIVLDQEAQLVLESGLDSTFTDPAGASTVNLATVRKGTVILKKGLLVMGE